MININLGPEPAHFASVRALQLTKLYGLKRDPTSDDISGYRDVAKELWTLQHYKCCYCELKLRFMYNDVEHYRPKAFADRRPGCINTHGYWWLAFTWGNLFYSCATCNRSHKRALFPLANGSISLMQGEDAPGRENPLVISPLDSSNPVNHIEFRFESIAGEEKRWWARPRRGSLIGSFTIDAYGLNDQDLLELREEHFNSVVSDKIDALLWALNKGTADEVEVAFDRAKWLLRPNQSFVAMTYDALVANVPENLVVARFGTGWPSPEQVGR
jgi:hypothetical protein